MRNARSLTVGGGSWGVHGDVSSVCVKGVCRCVWGGVSTGCVCPGGVCTPPGPRGTPRPRGTHTHPGPRTRHPPPRGQTDTCKNMTLPQTLFAGGKNIRTFRTTHRWLVWYHSGTMTFLHLNISACIIEVEAFPEANERGHVVIAIENSNPDLDVVLVVRMRRKLEVVVVVVLVQVAAYFFIVSAANWEVTEMLDICVQMMIWKVKFRAQCEFFVQKTVVGTKTTVTEVWSEVTGNDSNDVDIWIFVYKWWYGK